MSKLGWAELGSFASGLTSSLALFHLSFSLSVGSCAFGSTGLLSIEEERHIAIVLAYNYSLH